MADDDEVGWDEPFKPFVIPSKAPEIDRLDRLLEYVEMITNSWGRPILAEVIQDLAVPSVPFQSDPAATRHLRKPAPASPLSDEVRTLLFFPLVR